QRTTLRPLDSRLGLVIAVVEDVTVTHLQLEQLRRETAALTLANEKAKKLAMLLSKSNEELEQFAYVASHDLQEPLRKISSYCQLLEEEQSDRLTEEGKGYLKVVTSGADRLRRLVQDLLVFSRITTHGRPLAATNAEACFELALDNLEIAIRESNARITHDPLPKVLADEGQLTQVLQNLIANAIKYRSQAAPTIHVGVLAQGEACEIYVEDNGIGIEQRFHERIFRVFQRLHNRRDYDGTGIGLSLCKRIVERCGGSIRVESTPGEGSRFAFTLRRAEDAA
ncbi:MAG: hypothetical protein KDA37_13185, partial [Planctomycetales bacterium]|nr:hypothetical protein [Planctomycetales bacterium]